MLLSARQCYLYADDQPIVRTMVVAKNTQVKVVATRCAIVISDPIYLAHLFHQRIPTTGRAWEM